MVSSRPRALRSVEQGRDRLVDGAGVVFVAVLQVGVLVPAVAADGGTQELDEPHAPLDQAPGDQAFAGEDLGGDIRVVEAVEPLVAGDSPARFISSGTADLHAVGQLVVGDRRLERVVMADAAQHALVERAQQIELARLVALAWLHSG